MAGKKKKEKRKSERRNAERRGSPYELSVEEFLESLKAAGFSKKAIEDEKRKIGRRKMTRREVDRELQSILA